MKEKDKRPYVIAIVSVLVILVIVLVGYIVFSLNSKDKEEVVQSTTTVPLDIEDSQDISMWENYFGEKLCVEKTAEECIIYRENDIIVSYKDLEKIAYGYNVTFYINNNKIETFDCQERINGIKVVRLDDDNIFVEIITPFDSDYRIYDSNGSLKHTFEKHKFDEGVFDDYFTIRFDSGKFYYKSGMLNNIAEYCNGYVEADVVYYEKTYDYLGDGKIGEEEITLEKTVSDILVETYNVNSCDLIQHEY